MTAQLKNSLKKHLIFGLVTFSAFSTFAVEPTPESPGSEALSDKENLSTIAHPTKEQKKTIDEAVKKAKKAKKEQTPKNE